MANLANVVQQLRKERDQAQRRVEQLDEALNALGGLGGVRDYMGELRFIPRLPGAIRRLRFRITYRGRRLLIEVNHDEASYSLVEGAPLEIVHHGERATIGADEPLVRPIPRIPPRERPRQPPGREPARRQVRQGSE